MTDVGDSVEFPRPLDERDWPHPRDCWYPMKPTDVLLPDGQIESGALGRVKRNQHESRFVIRWDGVRWVVVRSPLTSETTEPS